MISMLYLCLSILLINTADAANLGTTTIKKDDEHHLVLHLYESANTKYIFDHQIFDKVENQQIDINSMFGMEYLGHDIARYVKIGIGQNFIHNHLIGNSADLHGHVYERGIIFDTKMHYTILNQQDVFYENFIPEQHFSFRLGRDIVLNTNNIATLTSDIEFIKKDKMQVGLKETESITFVSNLGLSIENQNWLEKNISLSVKYAPGEPIFIEGSCVFYLQPSGYLHSKRLDSSTHVLNLEPFHPTQFDVRYEDLLDWMDKPLDDE
ncbi:MAG: hypothetical protein VX112_04940 [Pseudomonadota bacterium]|nr:hypothetical protein [Pseudomonadota bacterium]